MFTFNEYRYQVTDKDMKRVGDIITKSKRDIDKEKSLSQVQANRIERLDKAIARFYVAEKLGKHEIAQIFLSRAEELDTKGIYKRLRYC